MSVKQSAFRPHPAATVNLAAGVASANVQVQSGQNAGHVRIFNSGAVTVFIEIGNTSGITAAVATGCPIAPGTIEVIACPFQYVAAITASGAATLYFTPGEGI
jgi:hypothetical protein